MPPLADTARVDVAIEKTETLRDTVIVRDADSSLIAALIACDSMGNAYFKQILDYQSGKLLLPPDLQLSGGKLTVKAKSKNDSTRVSVKDTYKTKYVTVTKTLPPVVTNKLTWWQQTQIVLSRLLLAAIGAYFLIKKLF
ncbi:hypothetical protein KTO58_19775 [Chitinophaga pendula]|uniref:hypothetical protein n=1 Tax=Chitinophaga TaxID=79328 RepID=UPI000BAFF720|nr:MULTISPECIES: hypothetical protein [Chitinophaga]ASZ11093.1 hypothetical protein CK934_09025 [Chitinophaga sp. MD30]UCJ05910.1 hypothetical protein KTO58_19775 [Chitinophaga pendula]